MLDRGRPWATMIPVFNTTTQSHPVTSVQFSVCKPCEIKKNSAARVSEVAIYQRGIPTHNGVNSLAMGSTDRRIRCTTCNELMARCPGHAGHIDLALPVYQALFIDHTIKVLRSVCYFCSEVCLSEEDKAHLIGKYENNKLRFANAYAMARSRKRCLHCEGPRPNYVRLPLGVRTDWPDGCFDNEEDEAHATQRFTPLLALSILDGVKDGDAQNFFGGGMHPRDLICSSILVPPPIIRPAISTAEGSRSKGQDDMTAKLQEINRRSGELRLAINKQDELEPFFEVDVMSALPKESEGKKFSIPIPIISKTTLNQDIVDRWNRLQADVFSLVNPAAIRGGLPAYMSSGRGPIATTGKCIVNRIRGKDGRFRNCLMGKRVNFSGRSVITPHPGIDVDQLGVPFDIAKILTVPEKVTPSNILEMRERVLNGPNHVFGAQSIITSEGDLVSLASCKDRQSIILRYGWVLERHLKNDDYVIFNRQPTLHRMGFNGHRVVLMEGSTFRLNLSVCAIYNADFDGDEMNIHVCQSACARSEVAILMALNRNLISAQNNKPCMGIVQDSLVGAWMITSPSVMLDKREMLRFLSCIKHPKRNVALLPPPCISCPVKRWSGLQLLSFLFCNTFNYRRGTAESCAKHETKDIIIANGEILAGRFSKGTIGAVSGGVSECIFSEYGGSKAAVEFLSDMQRVVNAWLFYKSSFSIGAEDCATTEAVNDLVVECIDSATSNSELILTKQVPKTLKPMVESASTQILNDVIMKSATLIKNNIGKENSVITCVTSGSKGSPLNISQIMGQVGQQIVTGSRILSGVSGRTLPCFKRDDVSNVVSNGFIQNSFALGLNPVEFFFSAMAGREGLVDTAVKTANSGYIQRCLVKSNEDNQFHYDTTVRNAQGNIVQFQYADNFEPRKVERVEIDVLLMKEEEILLKTLDFEAERIIPLQKKSLVSLFQVNKPTGNTSLVPFNMQRIFENKKWHSDEHIPLSSRSLFQKVSDAVSEIQAHHPAAKFVIPLYLHWSFRYENVPPTFRVASTLEYIKMKCICAAAAGGDAVGNTAALSIGEPSTQITLNSFHSAGTSHGQVTLGIPRLKEIMSYSKAPKTPQTTLFFDEIKDEFELKKKCLSLPKLMLESVVEEITVLRSEFGHTHEDFEYDMEISMRMETFYPTKTSPSLFSKHCSILFLQKHLLQDYGLIPSDVSKIVTSLCKSVTGVDCHVISSQENTIKWWIIVYFANIEKQLPSFKSDPSLLERGIVLVLSRKLAEQVKLAGMVGVSSSAVDSIQRWDGEKNVNEKIINVRGSILKRTAFIDGCNMYKSTTNDVHYVVNLLGIEAAMNVLFDEFHKTLTADGSYIDPRHLELVCNTMTCRGYVMPLNRHGLNNIKTGPLTRSSFEETSDVLKDAALFKESEVIADSVSASIMLGQLTSIGTGRFEVLFPKTETYNGGTKKRKVVKTKKRININKQENSLEVCFISIDDATFVDRLPYVPASPPRKNY